MSFLFICDHRRYRIAQGHLSGCSRSFYTKSSHGPVKPLDRYINYIYMHRCQLPGPSESCECLKFVGRDQVNNVPSCKVSLPHSLSDIHYPLCPIIWGTYTGCPGPSQTHILANNYSTVNHRRLRI